jgi:hypothetical protein
MNMKVVWKEILASVALSAVALSMIGTDGAAARNKSAKMEPPPIEKVKPVGDQPVDAPVERGKSGTIKTDPVQGEAPPSVERGIRDNGVKSCSGCGMTGREAAPPPVDDGAAPPSAEKVETGQLLDRCRGRPHCSGVTERRAHDGPGGTPPSTAAARNKTVWWIPTVLASSAALVAILASGGGGDDSPTSP